MENSTRLVFNKKIHIMLNMDNAEVWKQIKTDTTKQYFVSNMGRVKSVDDSGKVHLLSQCLDKNGYRVLTIGGKQFKAHRIVAEYFCRKRFNKTEVNHINGNKSDNRACNLEWVTHSRNQIHRWYVLKHITCNVVNRVTKQQYATIYEAHLATGTPVSEINREIMCDGDWLWKNTKKQ